MKEKVIIIRITDILFALACIGFSVAAVVGNIWFSGMENKQAAFLILSNMVWIMTVIMIACLKELIALRSKDYKEEDISDKRG